MEYKRSWLVSQRGYMMEVWQSLSWRVLWLDGVRVMQGCPMSPLLINICVRELGKNVARCKHGFKYVMVDREGLMVEKSQAGFLYAYDACLIASNEHDLQMIFDSISGCISEYGMQVSEKR